MIQLEENITVPQEVASYQAGDHEGQFRVLAIGDSITACGAMNRQERWTGILERLLGDDACVINAGIGGTSSSLGLYRWRRDVAPMRPHSVVICFLLNDSHIRHYECSSSYCVQCTPDRMEANMRAMFDLTRLSGAVPVMWTPPPVPTWGAEANDARLRVQVRLLEHYLAVLERMAADTEVPFVNFWREFPSLVEDYPGPYFDQPDGYHSNTKAQPILARGIRDALEGPLQAYRRAGK